MALFAQPAVPAASAAESLTKTTLVSDRAALEALARALEDAPFITFDVETTSTDAMQSSLVGISLCVKTGEAYYIPVGHTAGDAVQLPLPDVVQALTPAFANPAIHKYGHNLKFDAIVLAR